MRKVPHYLLPILVLFVVLACNLPTSRGTPPGEEEETEIPVINTAPTGTAQDTPTPQNIVPTSTPIPESLHADGPYILTSGQSGVWISNPDGSFLTQLTDVEIGMADLHRLISPIGDQMAYIEQKEDGLYLVLLNIPGGEKQSITRLLEITPDEVYGDPTSEKAFIYYAITQYDSIAWQPGDGEMLAFVGAINGSTSDLYLYNTLTEEISQLTDGPAQAIIPTWSPDGKYIYHFGVSWVPPFGGAIVGYTRMDGAWAVRVSDGAVIDQPKPKQTHYGFVGWLDDSHYILYDLDETCFSKNLRRVEVESGKATTLMDKSFYYQIARSPENGAMLFAGAAGCADSVGEGIFLLKAGESTPTQLDTKRAWEVNWLPESGVFQAYPEALFSADGSTRYDPPVYDKSYVPAISKNGYQAWTVIENQVGRVEVKVPGGDWQTIASGFFVDQLIWDPVQGDTLLIMDEDGLVYRARFP